MRRNSILCIISFICILSASALADTRFASEPGIIRSWGTTTDENYGQGWEPPGDDWIAISCVKFTNLAMRTDGSLLSWGRDGSGQVSNTPTGTGFKYMSAGSNHSCAIKADGSIVCWGSNAEGQCNAPSGTDYVQVAAGYVHSMALKADGSLVGWGAVPGAIPTGNDFVEITYMAFLRSDGSGFGWTHFYGTSYPPPEHPTGLRTISSGEYATICVKTDGSLYAWGCPTGITPVPAGTNYIDAHAGNKKNNNALRSDGTLFNWPKVALPLPNRNILTSVSGHEHAIAIQKPDRTPPPAPTGLTATPASPIKVDLSWTAVDDPDSGISKYNLYRGGSLIGNTTATAYSDTTAIPGTTLIYEVSAVNGTNMEGAKSLPANATTPPDTAAPTAPANLQGAAVSAYQVNLAWTGSTDDWFLAGYRVYRNSTLISTVTTTNFPDTMIEPLQSYQYKVAAIDLAGNESADSNPVNLNTPIRVDLNHDDYVDIGDLVVLAADWLSSGCVSPAWCNNTDIDHSGSADLRDYTELAGRWKKMVGVSVSISGTTTTAEGGSAALTLTRTGPTDTGLTVLYSVSGTATSGTDYTALSGSAIIPVGASSANITVSTINDTDYEADKTVIITLAESIGYKIGAPSSAAVTITSDDPQIPVVSITAAPAVISENGGTAAFTISHDSDAPTAVTVYYTVSGSAANGTDYVSITSSITIPPDQLSAAITITPINDSITESTLEDITITLNANAAYTLGTPSTATVNIEDDDWAGAGWTGISFDNFETGWGSFTSGGACATIDCTGSYATSGTCAANICDNLGVTSSFTTAAAINLTAYKQAKIVFDYKSGTDIRSSDDFFVEFSSDGGSAWSTAQSYLGMIDFTANNTKLDQEVLLVKGVQSFTANCKIRFKADTDQVSRDIFIDKVRIMASTQPATYTMFSDGFETDSIAAGIWTTDSTSNVKVDSSAKYTGSSGAKITKTSWLQKAISTAGTNNIHIKYVRKNGLDSGEASYVEWSTDGTNWNIVDTVAYNESWAVKDITCASGANDKAGFRIRFRCNSTNGDGDQMSVDDVSIVGTQM